MGVHGKQAYEIKLFFTSDFQTICNVFYSVYMAIFPSKNAISSQLKEMEIGITLSIAINLFIMLLKYDIRLQRIWA